MKVTDYVLIFMMTFLCLFVGVNTKNEIMYERIYLSNRYNVIMDNAVENALRAGYTQVDENGKPIVNKEEAWKYFLREIGIMFDGNIFFSDYYKENIKTLIYTEEEGFYELDSVNGWSELIKYPKGAETSHEQKIYFLLSHIYEKYKIQLSVPSNDGEDYMNTISDYSLISVYKSYDGLYCFSAAAIKKRADVSDTQKSFD